MAKMDIFLSWHGLRGNAVAAALQEWLPQIVNDFNPWFSSATDKGSRWRSEVATRLAQAKAGIICLTPSALTAPWLLFEAGAIAKSPEKTYACTILIDLKHEDVPDPLAQFQHTLPTEPELLSLAKTLNSALENEQMPAAHVEKAFEKWWPDLEKKLQNLPPDQVVRTPERSDRELLAEIIEVTRSTSTSVVEIAHGINQLHSMQAYIDTMLPAEARSSSWLGGASEVLGGGGENPENHLTRLIALRGLASRNALRDRLPRIPPPEKKRGKK